MKKSTRIIGVDKTMRIEVGDYVMVIKNGFFSFKEKEII